MLIIYRNVSEPEQQQISHEQSYLGATAFTSFPALAPEIRLQIWETAVPVGRAVPLEVHFTTGKYPGQTVPPMLHVNKESRDVALKHYMVYFPSAPWSDEECKKEGIKVNSSPIFYNPSTDVLVLRGWSLVRRLANRLYLAMAEEVEVEKKGKIRMIAIDEAAYNNIRPRNFRTLHDTNNLGLARFVDLEDIYCIQSGGWDSREERDLGDALHEAFRIGKEACPNYKSPNLTFEPREAFIERL